MRLGLQASYRNRGAPNTRRAFTLLEMLVALAVFAAIGVMSSRILSGMVDLAETTRVRGDEFSDLQRAMAIVQRDVEQLAHRSVRDELGDPLAPAVVGSDALLELTRLGWQNPLAAARSEMQRVAYVVEEDRLVRLFWQVLDRAPTSEPVAQTLLDSVGDVEFVAHDDNGETHRFWPQMNDDTAGLAAIALSLETTTYGRIERLWLVPASWAAIDELESEDEDGDDEKLDDGLDDGPLEEERQP